MKKALLLIAIVLFIAAIMTDEHGIAQRNTPAPETVTEISATAPEDLPEASAQDPEQDAAAIAPEALPEIESVNLPEFGAAEIGKSVCCDTISAVATAPDSPAPEIESENLPEICDEDFGMTICFECN